MSESEVKLDAGEDRVAPFQALAEGVREGVAILDANGVILYANDRLAQMLRLECADVLARPIEQFLVPDDRPRFAALLSQSPATYTKAQFGLTGANALPLPVEMAIESQSTNGTTTTSVVTTDLSRRRRAEEQIEFQARLLENVTDAVMATDAEFRLTFWNAAAERQYGWTADEVLGRPVQDVLRPEVIPETLEEYRRRLRETGELDTEHVHLRKDGTPIIVESRCVAMHGADGRTTGYVAVSRDVTERRRTEEYVRLSQALEQAHARTQTILASLAEGYTGLDRELVILEANATAEKMHGWTHGQAVGRYLWDVFPQVRDTDFYRQYRRALDENTPVHFEAETALHDRCYEVHAYPHRDGLDVYFHDITERKRAEDSLQRAMQELQHQKLVLSEAERLSHTGAWEWDLGNDRRAFSDEWLAIHGWAQQTLSPEELLTMAHPDDRNAIEKAFEGLWNGRAYHIEHRIIRQNDGETRWVRASGQAETDASGRVIRMYGFAQDITEYTRAQRALEQRAAELALANNDLESFSYSVSHDLRTPLASVLNFAELLLADGGDALNTVRKQYAMLIRDNAAAMDHLIQGLLNFSRSTRQPLRLQHISQIDLVQQAWTELFASQLGRRIELLLGDLPDAQGDPLLLKQVWLNLLSNALKFTRQREVARIEIGWYPGDSGPVYFVKDNGAGFDMADADNLFGVFRRLHSEEEYEGTGVGLAIVARIIRRHNGRVWAEAKPDEGATFAFTLG